MYVIVMMDYIFVGVWYCGICCRYMMLIDGVNSLYMIDRDNAVYSVPKMVFPKRKDTATNLTNTLLDGVSSAAEMPHFKNYRLSECEFQCLLGLSLLVYKILSIL